MGSSREPPDRFHNDNSPGIKSSPSSGWKVAGLHHDESYCELGKREWKLGKLNMSQSTLFLMRFSHVHE